MRPFIFYLTLLFFPIASVTADNQAESKQQISSGINTNRHKIRYLFAHQTLPALFFSNPAETLTKIEHNSSAYFKSVLSLLDKDGYKNIYPSSEIETFKIKKGDDLFVLIKPPHPEQPTEPYLISLAIVDKTPKYYIFEKLAPVTGSVPDEAVFCEWSKSRIHSNYGIGIQGIPSAENFMSIIDDAINGRIKPVIRTQR